LNPKITDTQRLDWLNETQALCDDGDGKEFYQEWRVTASKNYHGIREAIDATIHASHLNKAEATTAETSTQQGKIERDYEPEQSYGTAHDFKEHVRFGGDRDNY